MTIPQRFTTGDATFYVLVVSDDMTDDSGNPIVWEHPFPEGTELREVLKRQRSLGGRYGTSWVAECRIIPETRFATVKESLTAPEIFTSQKAAVMWANAAIAPADARSEHQPPGRYIPVPITERAPMSQELDSQGRCWFYDAFVCPGWLLLRPDASTRGTHWLPHWCFPVPGEEANRA